MHATSTKPALPPILVSYLSGTTRDAQRQALGWSAATLARHLRSGWGKWQVEAAEAFCSFCGFDFWALTLETDESRKKLRNVRWLPVGKRLRRVLVAVFRAAGEPRPTAAQVEALAVSLHHQARVNHG